MTQEKTSEVYHFIEYLNLKRFGFKYLFISSLRIVQQRGGKGPAVKGTLWTSIGIGVKLICQAIKNIKVHYGPKLELDFVREVD